MLGCTSNKEVCARFRAVNPATHCELDRLNKWLQGRALPRSVRFYEDWAKVLGSSRPGAWFASCGIEAFVVELALLFEADPQTLMASEHAPIPSPTARSAPGPHAYLLGSYACYSPAWSPYHSGKLIRGGLLLGRGKGTAITATYTERVVSGLVGFEGAALIAGRTLHVPVTDPDSGVYVFMTLFVPGPPASAMCGVMSGSTFLGQDPRPTACRMLAIRVPAGVDLAGTHRYFDALPGAIAADLSTLTLHLEASEAFDTLARDFLRNGGGGGLDQVSIDEQYRLTAMLDRSYLATADATVT